MECSCFAVLVDPVEVDHVGCERVIILALCVALLRVNLVIVEWVSECAFRKPRHCIGLASDVIADDPAERLVELAAKAVVVFQYEDVISLVVGKLNEFVLDGHGCCCSIELSADVLDGGGVEALKRSVQVMSSVAFGDGERHGEMFRKLSSMSVVLCAADRAGGVELLTNNSTGPGSDGERE